MRRSREGMNVQRPTFNFQRPTPAAFFVERWKLNVGCWTLCLAVLLASAACEKKPASGARQAPDAAAITASREREAKEIFERAAKQYHLPSAQAKGREREKLLAQAAETYTEVLDRF